MTDRHSLGQDPQFQSLEHDYDSEQTLQTLYLEGKDYLESLGFILERSFSGPYAFHKVYMKRSPYAIKGVNYPNTFRVLMPIHTSDETATLENAVISMGSDTLRKFWLPVVVPDQQRRKPLYAHTAKLIANDINDQRINSDLPFELGISPFCSGVPRAWVPKREWFDKALHRVCLEDIFTIFPPVERELLALILGRVLVGRSNQLIPGTEKVIRHTSRMAAIIVGADPGLGKSSIFSYFMQSILKCGYVDSTFSRMGARFNMADIANSDLCYKDDVTTDSLKNFFGAENTKIIITNGKIRVEDKGINAIDIPSHSAFIVNTNEFDPRSVYQMDPGSADRFKMLSTLREGELNKLRLPGVSSDSPNLRPYSHIEWLSKKLDVEQNALMLWSARLCVDRFYGCIEDTSDATVNPLEQKVDALTQGLRIKLYKDITAQVMSSIVFSYALLKMPADRAKQLKIKRGQPLVRFPRQFMHFDLLDAIKIYYQIVCDPRRRSILTWLLKNFEGDDLHPIHGFCMIDSNSLRNSLPTYLDSVFGKDPISKQLKLLFGNILLNDGFELSSDAVWLSKNYERVHPRIGDITMLASRYADLCSEHLDQLLEDASESDDEEEGSGAWKDYPLYKTADNWDEDYNDYKEMWGRSSGNAWIDAELRAKLVKLAEVK